MNESEVDFPTDVEKKVRTFMEEMEVCLAYVEHEGETKK